MVDLNTEDYSDKAGRELSEYLEVTVSQDSYDELSSGEQFKSKIIPTHPCTDAELGLDDSGNSMFEPIIEEERNLLVKSKPFFQCFDHS